MSGEGELGDDEDDDGVNLTDILEIAQAMGADEPILPPSQACRSDGPESSLGSSMSAGDWPPLISAKGPLRQGFPNTILGTPWVHICFFAIVLHS